MLIVLYVNCQRSTPLSPTKPNTLHELYPIQWTQYFGLAECSDAVAGQNLIYLAINTTHLIGSVEFTDGGRAIERHASDGSAGIAATRNPFIGSEAPKRAGKSRNSSTS